MITKTVGQVTFDLKEDFDFSFISEFGEPFVVFDNQDSGNLCFGVQKSIGGCDKKYFIKLAGAPTVRSNVTPEQAIERIKSTIPIYQDLSHPNLTQLIAHKSVAGGYILVLEWFDGKCMGKQYESRDRFLNLPTDEKALIYQAILQFHRHVNEKNYIAVDFYDGSIMYNFDTKQVMICDIEFYQKKPVINNMGRMWGSTRFMSPEEFELGAEIDERSNVFCMGATAFNLFGGEMDRSFEKWTLSEDLYKIASKAISVDKQDRHQSIGEYIEAWSKRCFEISLSDTIYK